MLLIPVSGMQIFHVNILWFFESLPDTKCSTDHCFHLTFFKSCVFTRDYKAMLLLSEVRNYSPERSLINIAAGLQCHAVPLLCRGKTAVTEIIVLAFQASICLQKSSLYYSNSFFCLVQNITYLFKRCY